MKIKMYDVNELRMSFLMGAIIGFCGGIGTIALMI